MALDRRFPEKSWESILFVAPTREGLRNAHYPKRFQRIIGTRTVIFANISFVPCNIRSWEGDYLILRCN